MLLPLQPGDLERPAHDHGHIQARHRILDKAQVLVQNRGRDLRRPQLAGRGSGVTAVCPPCKNSPGHPDGGGFMLSPRRTSFRPALYQQLRACFRFATSLLSAWTVSADIPDFRRPRDYSMRLWLDPDKIANLGLTGRRRAGGDPGAETCQIAGGQFRGSADRPIGPSSQKPQLHRPAEGMPGSSRTSFVKAGVGTGAPCGFCADVARIEIGVRLDYTTNSFLLRKNRGCDGWWTQRPGSEPSWQPRRIFRCMVQAPRPISPRGSTTYRYNPTEFHRPVRPA